MLAISVLMRWLLVASLLMQAGLALGAVGRDQALASAASNRFSLETLRLPGNERMGLLGGNFLLSAGSSYLGLGVYGAVTGRRGGFFTGGFEAGHLHCLTASWCVDAGMFVGGGGGGAAPQGGGLMLRPHLDVWHRLGRHAWGVGYSRVWFPNGAIDSAQWALSYQRFFRQLARSGWQAKPDGLPGRVVGRALGVQNTVYLPVAGHRSRSGRLLDQPMQAVGIRWRQHLWGPWWPSFETAGAWDGAIDGFAQVLAGMDYLQPLAGGWSWLVAGRLGAAGGGDVDTGGGMIARLGAGLNYRFARHWSLQGEFGQTRALEGEFAAASVNVALFYRYAAVVPGAGKRQALHWRPHRLRAGVQRYLLSGGKGRKAPHSHNTGSVDLVGLKLDVFASRHVFLTGQALGAFAGAAGGYAVGFLGLGWFDSGPAKLRYGGELTVGAAGGGGLAVGDGALLQAMINLGWSFSKAFGLEGAFGYTGAPGGSLRGMVGELSLVYRFVVPHLASE